MSRAFTIKRFVRSEDGAALVEFGLLLPSLLLVLGLVVEGGRTFFSYQTVTAGVRDASRYLSRAVQSDVCKTGATATTAHDAKLLDIVRNAQSGESLLPGGITIEQVGAVIVCKAGNYRLGTAPVATVTATLRITYPFAGLLDIAGIDTTPFNAQISDQARVVGS